MILNADNTPFIPCKRHDDKGFKVWYSTTDGGDHHFGLPLPVVVQDVHTPRAFFAQAQLLSTLTT
jgi:hypothetical protein